MEHFVSMNANCNCSFLYYHSILITYYVKKPKTFTNYSMSPKHVEDKNRQIPQEAQLKSTWMKYR